MPFQGLRTKALGFVHGELSAAGLEGLKARGADAYDLQERADEIRGDPHRSWDVETQLFLVCSWNAFALQSIADHVMAADARLDPGTAGLLPPATLAFAQRCYSVVPSWIEWARNAELRSGLRPSSSLPARLPVWPKFGRTRAVHVGVLEAAYDATAPRAAADAHSASAGAALDALVARMHASKQAAERLRPEANTHERLREVRDALVEALGDAYVVGQVAAMPSLIDRVPGIRSSVPLASISYRWLVIDSTGATVGTVSTVEGEPSLGLLTGIVISAPLVGTGGRRARRDQIGTAAPGLVRLCVPASELEDA
jgi:hypothetical protein